MTAAGCQDVVVYEEPDKDFASYANYPEWQYLTRRADGLRQVLRRKDNGECHLLTPQGCPLRLGDRPLICRLHPYDYNRDLIVGIEPDCPISTCADGMAVLECMNMDKTASLSWIRQLYAELDADKAADSAVACPELSLMTPAV